MKHILKLTVLNIVIAVVLLFGLDRSLAALGYPQEVPLKSAHRANVSKTLKTIEFEYEFATNDLGLRYPQIAMEKPAGDVRVLLIGDSFTEGVGVEADDTFGVYLENDYNNIPGSEVQFINAGLGGEGPPRFWRVFNDVGLLLDPDGVLICLYANDLMDTPESLGREDLYRLAPVRYGFDKTAHDLLPRVHNILVEAGRIIARELKQSEGFVATVTAYAQEQGISNDAIEKWQTSLPVELVEASDRSEFNKSLLSMGLFHPDFWSEAIDISTPKAERKYQAMNIVLDEIVAVARQREVAVGLVYIPAPLQYDPSRHASWNPWIIGGVKFRPEWLSGESEIQKRLAGWAQGKRIPFLDLTPALREEVAQGAELNYKLDGHWNAAGHRVAGKAIREWIDDNGVFPALPAAPGSDLGSAP
jgi:lysophospholipase L1-like esterase